MQDILVVLVWVVQGRGAGRNAVQFISLSSYQLCNLTNWHLLQRLDQVVCQWWASNLYKRKGKTLTY